LIARKVLAYSTAGYIDLSKKKVHKQEELDTLDKFAKAKTVNSIMRTLSESLKIDIEQVFKKIAWPLYRKTPQPLQILIHAMDDESVLKDLDLDEAMKAKLMSEIRRRFQPARVKIMSTFEVSINDFDGVNILKEALLAGQNKSSPDFKIEVRETTIQVTILGAPVYLMSVETDKKTEGTALIASALDEIRLFIEGKKGQFKVKEAVRLMIKCSLK
jgi:translation initiation factor 2 subunit 1